MQVLFAPRRSRELRVPFRPIFLLQKVVGRLHGLHLGQAKLLDQPVLIGEKTPLHPPFGLRQSRRQSSRFPTRAAPVQSVSGGPPGAVAPCFPLASEPPRTSNRGRCSSPRRAQTAPHIPTARPCSRASHRSAQSVPSSGWSHRRSSAPGGAPAPLVLPASRGRKCPTAPVRRNGCAAAATGGPPSASVLCSARSRRRSSTAERSPC